MIKLVGPRNNLLQFILLGQTFQERNFCPIPIRKITKEFPILDAAAGISGMPVPFYRYFSFRSQLLDKLRWKEAIIGHPRLKFIWSLNIISKILICVQKKFSNQCSCSVALQVNYHSIFGGFQRLLKYSPNYHVLLKSNVLQM